MKIFKGCAFWAIIDTSVNSDDTQEYKKIQNIAAQTFIFLLT